MSFRTSGGQLAYGSCNEACETPEGAWRFDLVEGQADLSAGRPMALPFTRDGEVWEGLSLQLPLDPDGRPIVSYDDSVEGRCLYQEVGDSQITYDVHQLWRGARLVAIER